MPSVKISFSSAFVSVTKGEKEMDIQALTLKDAFNMLVEKYGEPFQDRLFEANGKLKRFINVYINGKDVRMLRGLDTELKNGDEVTVLPAVSGG